MSIHRRREILPSGKTESSVFVHQESEESIKTLVKNSELPKITHNMCHRHLWNRCWLGASTGRATLEPRQHYAHGELDLAGNDLKPLVQFILLGDPAVTP